MAGRRDLKQGVFLRIEEFSRTNYRLVFLLTIVLVWIASGAVVAMVLVRRILSMEPNRCPFSTAQTWRSLTRAAAPSAT